MESPRHQLSNNRFRFQEQDSHDGGQEHLVIIGLKDLPGELVYVLSWEKTSEDNTGVTAAGHT
jgi:hypothetical protein